MASPFPGMDPFLEGPAYWSDFHSRFINYWCEAIADALPSDYVARLGERVYLIEHDPEARKLIFSDVTFSTPRSRPRKRSRSEMSVATLEPVTIPLTVLDGPRETYIEILHRRDRRVVSVLELLLPANKELPGRTEYLAKRRFLLFQEVHLVELDLLFGGRRLPLQESLPPAHYYYLVSRGDQRPDCQVYYWTLPEPLPRLPVPLRAPDPDILIDLGQVFATAYERGRFHRWVLYKGRLPASLPRNAKSWVRKTLAKRT